MPRPNRSIFIDLAISHAVDTHPHDLVAEVAARLKVSRTAVVERLKHMVADGRIVKEGTTRPLYRPGPNHYLIFVYRREGLAEDRVWRENILPALGDLPKNVLEIVEYGLTEMVNNAIDHSGGDRVGVFLKRNPDSLAFVVFDNGMGIFVKIAKELRLPDQRLALLELSKGKLTTDPSRHSGEGIFFTSRMFDHFFIRSGDLLFAHDDTGEKDILIDVPEGLFDIGGIGTWVAMMIRRDSARKAETVFAEFSSGPDDYAFAKTVVPVRMARLGAENLVSRSQAKRVLQGVDRFRHIVFDFAGVERIGQAFADEIFRVFALANPAIEIEHLSATPEVQQMIRRAEVLRDEHATGAAQDRTQAL